MSDSCSPCDPADSKRGTESELSRSTFSKEIGSGFDTTRDSYCSSIVGFGFLQQVRNNPIVCRLADRLCFDLFFQNDSRSKPIQLGLSSSFQKIAHLSNLHINAQTWNNQDHHVSARISGLVCSAKQCVCAKFHSFADCKGVMISSWYCSHDECTTAWRLECFNRHDVVFDCLYEHASLLCVPFGGPSSSSAIRTDVFYRSMPSEPCAHDHVDVFDKSSR